MKRAEMIQTFVDDGMDLAEATELACSLWCDDDGPAALFGTAPGFLLQNRMTAAVDTGRQLVNAFMILVGRK